MDTYEMKYKNALEWARQVVNGETGFIRKEVEEVFPELKESEDERIRQNCIHFLELQKSHHAATFEIEECIAWLEKQARSTTITIPEDLKGTDTDGGVVGEKGEQGEKPKWTEEDSLMIDSIIDTMIWLEGKGATNMKIDWLKSLKQRMEERQ